MSDSKDRAIKGLKHIMKTINGRDEVDKSATFAMLLGLMHCIKNDTNWPLEENTTQYGEAQKKRLYDAPALKTRLLGLLPKGPSS